MKDDIVDMFIEITPKSKMKYELDKESGVLVATRVLDIMYPGIYGFVPNTLAPDGDALDILTMGEFAEFMIPNTKLDVQVIDVLEMEDENGVDNKIIALFKDSHQLYTNSTQHRIRYFFNNYKKKTSNGIVTVGKFLGKKKALQLIEEARIAYKAARSVSVV